MINNLTKYNISLKGKLYHERYGNEKADLIRKKASFKLKNRKVSDETKRKLSIVLKGRIFSDKHKQNISIVTSREKNGMYGKKHTISAKKTMSIARKKAMNNFELREKIRNAHLGKHLSTEHKFNISKNISGFKNPMYNKKHTITTKNKISISNRETYKNLEVRRKISNTRKKLFAENKLISSMKNKKHSKKALLKMSLSKKGVLSSLKGITRSLEIKKKISIATKLSMTENVKQKIRNSRKNQILPLKDTSIEVKIQNFLKQLNIEFFTHQHMKEIEHGYQCDILIPSLNLVIECDGNYWHKYPIGNEIDHIRTKELIERGFKVLRLWEHEIKVMNAGEFEMRLKNLR